jgi:hypothetical protein
MIDDAVAVDVSPLYGKWIGVISLYIGNVQRHFPNGILSWLFTNREI